MIAKTIGVILVIVSCGGVGFQIAINHRKEENALRQLINILNFMENQLKYRLTPLPELCKQIATEYSDMPGSVFYNLALEMDKQVSPDMMQCMGYALQNSNNVPPITYKTLELLGKNIGRFDLEGQVKGIEVVCQDCKRNLELLSINRDNRLRSYQTLGLCAGAALAILFV